MTRRHPSTPVRRRGFMLLTMLVVLILLGVGALLASRLFLASLRTTAAAQETHTRAVRFDGMLRQLRQDVWSAGRIDSVDTQTFDLITSAGTVQWRFGADAAITRTALEEPAHRWALGPAAIHVEARPAGIDLHVSEDRTGQAQIFALVSQLLLRGETP